MYFFLLWILFENYKIDFRILFYIMIIGNKAVIYIKIMFLDLKNILYNIDILIYIRLIFYKEIINYI